MTIKEMSAFFYGGVIINLRQVQDEYGNTLSGRFFETPFTLDKGYEDRPNIFSHNYQRNKFLHSRDKYVVAYFSGLKMHLITEVKRSSVVLYRKPLKVMFLDEAEKAEKVLLKLLHKMYDDVRVEEVSSVKYYDKSNQFSPSRSSFSEIQ